MNDRRDNVRAPRAKLALLLCAAATTTLSAWASGPHRNPTGEQDEQRVRNREDVASLPGPLKFTLGELAERPHTFAPMRAFAEADKPSQLFQYYLLDTRGFQPNVFTAVIPGINNGAIPTAANAANGRLPTVGAVRVVLEPKPGLPTDPTDVEAF